MRPPAGVTTRSYPPVDVDHDMYESGKEEREQLNGYEDRIRQGLTISPCQCSLLYTLG